MLDWIYKFSARLGSAPAPAAANPPLTRSGCAAGAWNKPVRTITGAAPSDGYVFFPAASPPWSAPVRKPEALVLRRSVPARVEVAFARPVFAPGRSQSARSLPVVEHA